jgi:hypothetical protein
MSAKRVKTFNGSSLIREDWKKVPVTTRKRGKRNL